MNRLLLMASFAFLLMGPACRVSAADVPQGHGAAGQGEVSGGRDAAARDQAAVAREMPDVDMPLMLRFYGEYAPDLLEEWKGKCASHPQQSAEYLRGLAVHFRKLEYIHKADPEEYARLLEYEGMQSRIRQLAKEIRRLKDGGAVQAKGGLTEAERQSRLARAREDLQTILEKAFDESMRQQAYEIDKLEIEVAELRRLLEIRRLNRQTTLKQRFAMLVGE